MNKKSLSERDICTKYITPALEKAGWDKMEQIRDLDSPTKKVKNLVDPVKSG